MLPIFAAAVLAPSSDRALDQMIASELSFSKTCGIIGIRDSFLRYFAPDCLMFTPNPVNARQELSSTPPQVGAPRAILKWWPAYGDMAASGDLGYSTGPVIVTETASGKSVWNSYYFSIWKRQPDGRFLVVVDRGVQLSNPRPASEAPTRFARATTLGDAPKSEAFSPEGPYLEAIAQQGYLKAVRQFAAPGARFYRPGKPMLEMKDATAPDPVENWRQVKSEFSAAGDLYYSVSRFESKSRTQAIEGSAVRVWKRNGLGEWKLVIEIFHPNA